MRAAVLLLWLVPAVEGGDVDATFPAIGRITSGNLFVTRTCTGTLIAPDVVLTAGHCISPAGELTFDVTDDDGTTSIHRFSVATALAHPGYEPIADDAQPETHSINDVGVLLLREAVSIDGSVPLPIRRNLLDDSLGGEPVTAFGYGATRTAASGTKRSVELYFGTLFEDSYLLVGVDLDDTDQSGTVTVDKGLCPGDSGGPDLMRGPDDALEIVGVHAMGSVACSLAESTRLDTHLERFIDPVLAGDVPDGCSGDTLDAAVCNAAVESGGCSAAGTTQAAWALGAALACGLRARRTRR
ncbi:MAG: trypsin-like serine protease [Deltaproteobacteria bacterium]|nr:trypsin-like serine protease [Deltaproteobacteria bacterium]